MKLFSTKDDDRETELLAELASSGVSMHPSWTYRTMTLSSEEYMDQINQIVNLLGNVDKFKETPEEATFYGLFKVSWAISAMPPETLKVLNTISPSFGKAVAKYTGMPLRTHTESKNQYFLPMGLVCDALITYAPILIGVQLNETEK